MGFVGREAVSLQIIHSDPVTGKRYICTYMYLLHVSTLIDSSPPGSAVAAVGSEDCSVCLVNLQPSSGGHTLAMKTEKFIQGHISSVRALSTSRSMRGLLHQTLLFSGGARASLKVWKINGVWFFCCMWRYAIECAE